MTAVLIALAGGLGAALRFLVDGAVARRFGPERRWGTFVVNVTGSFALGVVAGSVAALGTTWTAVLGTGLLGGYTTFSTASFEAVRLLRERAWTPALRHTLGMLGATVLAAWAGVAVTG